MILERDKRKALTDGVFIKTRNGRKGVTIGETFIMQDGGKMLKDDYNFDLTSKISGNADIVEIYMFCRSFIDMEIMEPFWRNESNALDNTERKYLTNIINPFRGRRVRITKLRKTGAPDYAFIGIRIGEETIDLPYFKINEMYTGLEAGRRYTPEELDI